MNSIAICRAVNRSASLVPQMGCIMVNTPNWTMQKIGVKRHGHDKEKHLFAAVI